MDFMWDPITKCLTVIYENIPAAILGPFADRQQAISAGEEHCRGLGWKPDDQGLA
jgi:hypothetical protein